MGEPTYGYEAQLQSETDVSEVVARVAEALKAEGFGILSEIDVAKTLDAKLGVQIRPYRILGACNPTLAQRAIELEPHIGLLLPCNVLVQGRDGGGFTVSFAAPRAMVELTGNDALNEVMAEADARLRRVAQGLRASP